ncbi:MAG: tetratricopeptide repeat-containing diguanylate cyclase [Pseudomonadota bacterium]
MLEGLNDHTPGRCARALLAALCLLANLAHAQGSLDEKLAKIDDTGRYVPEKALAELLKLEAGARSAPPPTKTKFLLLKSFMLRQLGQKVESLALAEEVLAFGRAQHDNVIVSKGMLSKAFTLQVMDRFKESQDLVLEAEKVANTTGDLRVRSDMTTSAAEVYAAAGNFPLALAKEQAGLMLARQSGVPQTILDALESMAGLYMQMKEYGKAAEMIDEALALAEKIGSPGRMAGVKALESSLASDTKQPARARDALLVALEIERKLGAEAMVTSTLVDLADSYLKAQDYQSTLRYSMEAMTRAQRVGDATTVATAQVNLGEAYLAMGRVAEGKRNMEAGLAYFEKSGDKPYLQSLLLEFGDALEHAGDLPAALAAYHRERALSNELFEKQRQKAIYELQEKYEADKRQRQIELLRRENEVKSAEINNRRLQQRVWWLLALVFALAAVIVGLLYRKVRQANAQLEVKNLELKAQSSRDPLTALYNRRHFQEFMRTHTQVEKRGAGTSGEEIVGALFLLDVDHFKHVNDTYGHAAGDAVLRMIADNLRVVLRETDMIVRWGGEEFLAFLPAIPRSGVEEIARRLLGGISSHTIEYQDNKISVNVSIGFAPFPLVPGDHPLPWERAVNLVDMALYLAKAHGRNRAYGVRGFANFDQTSMESIEQDLERAWRAGFVDLSIVLGGWTENAPEEAEAPLVQAAALGAS